MSINCTYSGMNQDQFVHNRKNKCCKNKEYWQKVGYLIASIALGILIFPLFLPAYYSNIKKAYRAVKFHGTDISDLNKILESVRASGCYKDQNKLKTLVKEFSENTEGSLGKTAENNRANFLKSVKEKHSNHPLIMRSMGAGILSRFSYHWRMYMPGVAVIATYLRQKHNLKDLYVCDTLIAFQEKFKQIANSPNDERIAMVVPIRPLSVKTPDMCGQSQHKSAVCIEKKNGKLKIAYFESEPTKTISSIIYKPFKDVPLLEGMNVLLWFLYQSGVSLDDAEVYVPNTVREKSFGCESFALRDCVCFLQNPDFFSCIQSKPDQGHKNIRRIDVLPPEFMKGTQSMKTLDSYLEGNSDLAKKQIKHKNSTETLSDCVRRHTVNIEETNKKQNYYISSRSYKYHLILMEAIEKMKTEDLVACMKESLVEAPPDQFHPVNRTYPYPWDDFQYLHHKKFPQVPIGR